MATGSTGEGGSPVPCRGADGPGDSERTGSSADTGGNFSTSIGNTACSGSAIGSIDSPVGGSASESSDSPDADGPAWESLSTAELEELVAGLPPVEIHPWGDHALAVTLRSGARVAELRAALRFLPEDAALEGVYGDVEFAAVFEIPHGTES